MLTKILLIILIILITFLIIKKLKKNEGFGKKFKKLKKGMGKKLKPVTKPIGNIAKKGYNAAIKPIGNIAKKGFNAATNTGGGGGGGGGGEGDGGDDEEEERDINTITYSDLSVEEQTIYKTQAKIILDKFKKTLENRRDADDVYSLEEITEILKINSQYTIDDDELISNLLFILQIYKFGLNYINQRCQNPINKAERDSTVLASKMSELSSYLKNIERTLNEYSSISYPYIIKLSNEIDTYDILGETDTKDKKLLEEIKNNVIELKHSHLETEGENLEKYIQNYIKISENFLELNPKDNGFYNTFCNNCKGKDSQDEFSLITCNIDDYRNINYIVGNNIQNRYNEVIEIEKKIKKIKKDFIKLNTKTRLTDLFAANQSDKKFKKASNLFEKTQNASLSGTGNPDIDIGNNATDFSPNVENPDLTVFKPDYFKTMIGSIKQSFNDFNDGKLEEKYRNSDNFYGRDT